MKQAKKVRNKKQAEKIQHEELKEISGGGPQTQTCVAYKDGTKVCTGRLGPTK